MRIVVSLLLLLAAGSLSARISAQDAYPGVMCSPQRGGTADSDEAGRVLNPSPRSSIIVICPILPDPGRGQLSAVVWVLDQSPESVSCSLRSRTRDGEEVASSVAASGGQSSKAQVLAFPPIARGEYAFIACTLPPSYGNARSGITAYKVASGAAPAAK
jgi:hypothetical protein